MKVAHDIPKRAYINVMELLVAEEVEKQIQGLPPRVLKYLHGVEVETYALNRLPALYASSEQGWQHQYEKAKRELGNQIKSTVRQAIAAVQVDPIRSSEPLQLAENESAYGALEALRELLKQPDLSWESAINRLRVMLNHRSSVIQEPNFSNPEASHRTRHRQNGMEPSQAEELDAPAAGAPPAGHAPHWRPGTYGAEVSWQKTHHYSPSFDWNDPRYSK